MNTFLFLNRFYFILLALTIMFVGVILLFVNKPEAIVYFSENRTPFGDSFFPHVTRMGEEPMYLIFGVVFLYRKLRYSVFLALTGFVVMGVSYGLKSLFAIDRPLAYFQKNGMLESINFVQGVDVHSAATSFPSGHAMSAFALYTFLIFLLPKRKRLVGPLFLIAMLVAISRVYIVQHFLIDVYVGSIIGALIAVGMYLLCEKFQGKLEWSFNKEKPA